MKKYNLLPTTTNDAMDKLRSAMTVVLENWADALDERYPFNDSFDEVIDQVYDWQQSAAADRETVYNALKVAAEKGMQLFEYEGIAIVDAFADETSRFMVDPLKYYGNDKLQHAIFVMRAGGLL